MHYDVIGDIHGYADALTALLRKMGYREEGGAWRHPGRQVVFVGDFIDRGPKQVETVSIARRMVDAGTAMAVMGNHELNAIGWYKPDPENPGEYLRKHTGKNFTQHEAFLREVNGTPQHAEIVAWFMTLPLWLELPGLNVVHACWHEPFMSRLLASQALRPDRTLPDSQLEAAFREPVDEASKDNADFTVFKSVEALTKGMEVNLPAGYSFQDADNHTRTRVRVQWWRSGDITFAEGAEAPPAVRGQLAGIDPGQRIPSHALLGYSRQTPVLFGHYWRAGVPAIIDGGRLACIDYSIARGGKLVAYRWEGEPLLTDGNLISL